jgi:hypothetical protein
MTSDPVILVIRRYRRALGPGGAMIPQLAVTDIR